MLERVPIEFEFGGNSYIGELSQVRGAGSTAVYHLMIDQFYRGRLRLSAFDNSWVFDGEFADMAEAFGVWLSVVNWAKNELAEDRAQFLRCLVVSRFASDQGKE